VPSDQRVGLFKKISVLKGCANTAKKKKKTRLRNEKKEGIPRNPVGGQTTSFVRR
jgi:hypothetical protein